MHPQFKTNLSGRKTANCPLKAKIGPLPGKAFVKSRNRNFKVVACFERENVDQFKNLSRAYCLGCQRSRW